MIYWYILIILIIIFTYMRFEATWLKVEHIKFTKSKKGLKLIHLSDIHINKLRVSHEKIRSVLKAENPDVIILSGDYIEAEKDIPRFLDFLKLIRSDNMYLCLGNHDYEAFSEDSSKLECYINQIKSTGVEILHNQSACIEKNSSKYNIIGIADIRYNHHNIGLALDSCCDDALMNIAFSHNPDIVLEIPKGKIDYLFCGHFHGGQIWAPFNLEFNILRKEKLCKMGYRRGLHKLNGINLYINRGLGNVLVPLRLFSRPEIAVIYLP